jgi:hypothetical protein
MGIEKPLSTYLTVLTVFIVMVLFAGPRLSAQDGVYSGGLFELGDGAAPPGFPGMGNIVLSATQEGPDWEDLFDAAGTLKDDDGNGVPDYQELFGGRWAVFSADDVSLGTGFESTAITGDGRIYNGTVAADHDIGNAYAYLTTDTLGNVVVYAGVERLGGGDSYLEIELNQDHFRLGHGGFGVGAPWSVKGSRVIGDVQMRLDYAAIGLVSVGLATWDGSAWVGVDTLSGESCNLSETFCAVCNASPVDGGPWANHDTVDDPEEIASNRFVEVGLNAGALLSGPDDFTTVRLRTPEDAAFGYFTEGN